MPSPFREYEPHNFDNIQSTLVPYIQQNYPDLRNFWNRVDQPALFDAVPELATALQQLTDQLPVITYLLVIPNAPLDRLQAHVNGNSIHRDTSIESSRLNWPVINSDSIETKFFTSDQEPKKFVLPTGETYLTYQESDCTEIASFCMTRPTVFHVHTIHGLYLKKPCLPRYILSFVFENSIEHLL